jgi:predicted HD phosphohydrolase
MKNPLDILESRGSGRYDGESITQLEHALQCAEMADGAGVADELVIAALFHDIGHLLFDEMSAVDGVDNRHEDVGANWLKAAGFPAAVWRPVQLHVEAKRFVTRADGYELSEESAASLVLQGGTFTEEEARHFTTKTYWHEATLLRTWDDQAKIIDKVTPPLSAYAERVRRLRST